MTRFGLLALLACSAQRPPEPSPPQILVPAVVDASIVDVATIVDASVPDVSAPVDDAGAPDAALDPAALAAMRAQLGKLAMHVVGGVDPAPHPFVPPKFKGGEGRSYGTRPPEAEVWRSKPTRMSAAYVFAERVDQRMQQAQRCFDLQIREDIHAHGEVVIDFAIDTGGVVQLMEIKGPLSDAARTCIEHRFDHEPFGIPPTALLHVVYTLSFIHYPQPTDP